ncbi:MAG: hypothetical protein IPN16_01900 [Gemmatimonadetes bacterium]|nr:hypothetical protein [Gemmatimonadota bacterium]
MHAESAVLEPLGLDAPRQDALGALLVQSAITHFDAAAGELGLACEGTLRLRASRFARRGAAMWRTAMARCRAEPTTWQTNEDEEAAAVASILATLKAHAFSPTT